MSVYQCSIGIKFGCEFDKFMKECMYTWYLRPVFLNLQDLSGLSGSHYVVINLLHIFGLCKKKVSIHFQWKIQFSRDYIENKCRYFEVENC